jgi:restriction system protein
MEDKLPSGTARYRNQIAWARFYLTKAGYLDSSKRGVWSLTEKGQSATLTQAQVAELVKSIGQKFVPNEKPKRNVAETSKDETAPLPEAELESSSYREQLLQLLQNLPPAGFERLCQRLLREAGFEQVIVTGKSGDGGIDGHGILLVNPFVSFKVMFQCKRYAGSVGSPQVRDFRGSMAGRADKGIILTTGNFTLDAQKEAVRDGATPIELVGSEKLLDMFEKLELGLKPRTTFDVDTIFFAEFCV